MHINIKEVSEQFRIHLGEQILKRNRIYLDTKYWVLMRDAALGKATPIQIDIYNKLKKLVQNGIVICPLSPHVFQELMNIGDEQKRLQTAKVMDELSIQVTFISPMDIAGQELICFIRNCQNKTEGKPDINSVKYVWTKVAFILGEFYPFNKNFSEAQNEYIQVEFFMYCLSLTLVKMLAQLRNLPTYNTCTLISSLNKGKDHNLRWKEFHDVFMQEVAGILDVLKDDIREICKYLCPADVGSIEEIQRVIYNAFKLKKIDKQLPFLHIQAAINAFIRYNKMQRFKINDLIDISHASWALAYCNAFFTERRLASWICNPLLNLQQIYQTSVLYKEEKVLNYLSCI